MIRLAPIVPIGKTFAFIGAQASFKVRDAGSIPAWRTLAMQQTPARSKFKERFGQSNHFLITNLVALHHLERSEVISAPQELHTSWNPKDRKASIRRTREFTLEAFLGSAVDGIDMYLTLLYRKPNYIQDRTLESVMDGTSHSVARKVNAFAKHYDIEKVAVALVDVLITWRNNVIHALAENDLQESTVKILKDFSEEIGESYRGLDPTSLASKAKRGESLTFKETASLIRATHNFVELVDTAVLARLDLGALCMRVVQDALDSSDHVRFAPKYFSLPQGADRRRYVANWLVNRFGIRPTDLGEQILDECVSLKRTKSSQ
jgi:hypothetical protein